MIQSALPSRSFSASTELWLLVDGRRIEVGQMGGDFIISQEDAVVPPGTCCELHATVGTQENVWPIVLPEGLGTEGKREARIEDRAPLQV